MQETNWWISDFLLKSFGGFKKIFFSLRLKLKSASSGTVIAASADGNQCVVLPDHGEGCSVMDVTALKKHIVRFFFLWTLNFWIFCAWIWHNAKELLTQVFFLWIRLPVRWGGAYVTCGINIIKFCFTLFLKLGTADPCGLWTYFQRDASSLLDFFQVLRMI